MFRGLLMIVLLLGGIGVDVFVWDLYRVNYLFIFNLDLRYLSDAHKNRIHVLAIASSMLSKAVLFYKYRNDIVICF